MDLCGLSCNDLKFHWKIEPIRKEEAKLKVLMKSEECALKRIAAEREKNVSEDRINEEDDSNVKDVNSFKCPAKIDDNRQETVLRLRCERRRKKLARLHDKKLDILWNFVKEWLKLELNRLSIEPCLKNNPAVAKLAEFYSRCPIEILDEERVWKSVEEIMKSCEFLANSPGETASESEECSSSKEGSVHDGLEWIDGNDGVDSLSDSTTEEGMNFEEIRKIGLVSLFEKQEDNENALYEAGSVGSNPEEEDLENEHVLLSVISAIDESSMDAKIGVGKEEEINFLIDGKDQKTITAQDMSTLHGQINHAYVSDEEADTVSVSSNTLERKLFKVVENGKKVEVPNQLRIDDPRWKVKYIERVASCKCPWRKNRGAKADWELARRLQLAYDVGEIDPKRFSNIVEEVVPLTSDKKKSNKNKENNVKSLRFTLKEEAQVPACSDKMHPTVTTTSSSPENPTLTVSVSQTCSGDGRNLRRHSEKSPRFSKNRVEKRKDSRKTKYNYSSKCAVSRFKTWPRSTPNDIENSSQEKNLQTHEKISDNTVTNKNVKTKQPKTKLADTNKNEAGKTHTDTIPQSTDVLTETKFSFFTDSEPIFQEDIKQESPNINPKTTTDGLSTIVPPLDLRDLSPDVTNESKLSEKIVNVSDTYDNTIILRDNNDFEQQYKMTDLVSKPDFVGKPENNILNCIPCFNNSFGGAPNNSLMFEAKKTPSNAFDFTFQGGMIAGPTMATTPKPEPPPPPYIPFRAHRPTKTAQCPQVRQNLNSQFPTTYQPYGEAWFKAITKSDNQDSWATQKKLPGPMIPSTSPWPVQYPTPSTSSSGVLSSNEIAASHIKRILRICDEEQNAPIVRQSAPKPVRPFGISALPVPTATGTIHQNYASMSFRSRLQNSFVPPVPVVNSQRICLVRPQCVQNACGDARVTSITQVNSSHVHAPPFTPGIAYRQQDCATNAAKEDAFHASNDDSSKNPPSFFPSSCVFDATLGI
ncbi:uncharacterized protein LOC120333283 [Styela clava]